MSADLSGKGGIDADIGVKPPSTGVDLSAGLSSPEVDGPDVDVDGKIKKDKKGGFNISLPDWHLPKFGGKGKMDTKAKKTPSSKFSMPKFNMFKGKTGKLDIAGAEAELDAPDIEVNADGDAKLDSGDVKLPQASLSADANVEVPDIEMPGKNINIPDADVNIGANVDVPKPDVDVDINPPSTVVSAPDANISLEGPSGGVGLDVDTPKISGDASMPDIGVDVEGPSADVKGPSADVNVDMPSPKAKGSGGFGFKLPKFPNLKGSASVNAPSGGAELDADLSGTGDVGSPSVDVDLPSADVNVKAPEIDVDAKVPSADIDEPKVNISGEGPDIDLDLKHKKDKGGFGFSLPKFGGKGKLKGDADINGVDVDASVPDADVNAEINAPSAEVDVKVPSGEVSGDADLDISVPSADTPKPKGKGFSLKMPKIKFPSLKGRGKGSGPDVDVNVGGKLSVLHICEHDMLYAFINSTIAWFLHFVTPQ